MSALPPVPCDALSAAISAAGLSRAKACVWRAFARAFTPRVRSPMDVWLRENLRLTDEQSPMYGGRPFDMARIPHARIIADFFADPHAETLSVIKSSAAAFSSMAAAAVIYMLRHEPGNMLYLLPNLEEAKKLSKRYWIPWLRQVFGQVMDGEEQGALHIRVAGVSLYFGSPTEGFLRNKQVKYLIEDEGDTFRRETMLSGGDLDTSENERTKNANPRKIIRLCTPLFEYVTGREDMEQPGTRIHRHYLAGDRREYRCPCPHCAMENPLRFEDLDYSAAKELLAEEGRPAYNLDAIESATVWRCPSCTKPVADNSPEKEAMIRAGRWVPTVESKTRRFWSAHHTDMISLLGPSTSWGRIAAEMERTSGTREWIGIRRAHLAIPESRAADGEGRTREHILQHCGTHSRGECPVIPWGGLILTVDVNRDTEKEAVSGGVHLRFPWMLGAVEKGTGALYVVDWGEEEDIDDVLFVNRKGSAHAGFGGLMGRTVPFAFPAEKWAKLYPGTPLPASLPVKIGFIDSGYRAKGKTEIREDRGVAESSVYGTCLKSHDGRAFRLLPVKGAAGQQWNTKDAFAQSEVEVRGVKLPLFRYDDPTYKSGLNLMLVSNPAKPHALARNLPRVHFPRREDVPDGLIEHLTAERLQDTTKKLRDGRMWRGKSWHVPEGRENDWWDCLKWLYFAGDVLRAEAARAAA